MTDQRAAATTLFRSQVIVGPVPGSHLLITGGVHGDEYEPMAAIRRLARLVDPQMLRGRLTLVPVVNARAFALRRRAADDGLDLARTCPGRPDGSVTERVAWALTELIRSADAFIDLHTGGSTLSIWPLCGYMLHPDAAVLARQRAMARAFNLPVVWGTEPSLPGRSLSVARDAQVPAIYAEYLGGGGVSSTGVAAYIEGCLNVLGLLGMLDRPAPPDAVRWVVEDPRPQSGHLQRCYPAPAAGYFEPVVELGQRVGPGTALGLLVDLLGESLAEVASTQAGRVLALRACPAVDAGESLAVILETSD